jgi:hypothetical protein
MVFLCLAGCRESRPIVGTWFVKTPEAPFPYHMLVFHSDGTVGAERVGDARVPYRLIQLHQHHATVSGRRQRGDQQTVISARQRAGRGTQSIAADAIRHQPLARLEYVEITGNLPTNADGHGSGSRGNLRRVHRALVRALLRIDPGWGSDSIS